VVEVELDRGARMRRPVARAVEDHVLHRIAAQRRGARLAEHPANGVDDVRFSAAVRPDDADELAGNVDAGWIDEGLESGQLDLRESHGKNDNISPLDALAPKQAVADVFQPCSRARFPHPHGDPGVHLSLPDDRAAGLRRAYARLHRRQALRRAEIAQALCLVVSQRRRVPRGGDQPDPRRPGARDQAALDEARGEVQRARRDLHHGDRRAREARIQEALNPLLERLQPYPFEKLRALIGGHTPNPALQPINLSIGEPKHPTPALVKDALAAGLDGLSVYPATAGTPELRQAIAGWLERRYGIPRPESDGQVLPVNGTREALFAFAQTVLAPGDRVVCPNPFYQIYEGAALLAGATPVYGEPESWEGVKLLYVCSPANPTGKVLDLQGWKRLLELSDRHGFAIASDECYSEIYFNHPPLGALEACHKLGRSYERVVAFSSLSK